MSRSATTLLLLGAIVLVLFPLGIHKPGLPTTLKADEPAYYMMAESLAKDLDLQVEVQDIRRLVDEFPILPVTNVILMTDDAWHTVYYGKPYIYPFLAAPWVALFGSNGMVSFNMAMTALMIALGYFYLRRFNSDGISLAFAAGFFVLSSAFAYNYWLHPEIFNMVSAMLCLFFAFHEFARAETPPSGRIARWLHAATGESLVPLWSGAFLAFGAYNKPMLVAFALPCLWIFYRRGGWKRATAWLLAFVVMMGLICGVAIAFTGHPSAYLGVWRAGPPIRSQNEMPELPVGVELPQEVGKSRNSWEWLARIPKVDVPLLAENLTYFFVGRHTGLFPYMPFTLVSLLLFLLVSRRSISRWLTIAALAAIGLFFLTFIAFNWHGGGGFIGNRYFVIAYPAFLFLVTKIKPQWLTAVGYGLGALYLAGILTTPFGQPVRKPTLQAHVRNPPYKVLPLEFSLRKQIPGYWGDVENGVWFWGRKDVFEPHGHEFLIYGAAPVEVWLMVPEPLGEMAFQVGNIAPGNRIEISLGGDKQVVEFQTGGSRTVVLRPKKPYKVRRETNFDNMIYKMVIDASTSQILRLYDKNADPPRPPRSFALGARIAYLGAPEDFEAEVYSLQWEVPEPPTQMAAGATVELMVTVTNSSGATWPDRGAARVKLAYHWLTPEGEMVEFEGVRRNLPRPIEPGERFEVALEIEVPEEPGSYVLELDAIRERFAWFSHQDPENGKRIEIEVVSE